MATDEGQGKLYFCFFDGVEEVCGKTTNQKVFYAVVVIKRSRYKIALLRTGSVERIAVLPVILTIKARYY